ncbi:MAG: hypothetical protein DRQ99_15380 [Candidatus Parabeggiatoa sp. nov. 3]|nr:MAG: hypothetical protein DRQ99_15380 [Gammaproteobacteria bacterium]
MVALAFCLPQLFHRCVQLHHARESVKLYLTQSKNAIIFSGCTLIIRHKYLSLDGGQQKPVTHHFTRFVSRSETLA